MKDRNPLSDSAVAMAQKQLHILQDSTPGITSAAVSYTHLTLPTTPYV